MKHLLMLAYGLAILIPLAGPQNPTSSSIASPTAVTSLCNRQTPGDCGNTDDDSLNYYYSASDRKFYGVPGGGQGSDDGQQYDYDYKPVCPATLAPKAPILTCNTLTCTVDGSDGIVMMLYRRPAGTTEPWEGIGDACITSEHTVTLDEVTTAAEEELHKVLAPPAAHTAPGPRALINLPVLFWTTDHGPQTLTIDQPLHGTITAEPTYTWSFPHGHTAIGPGAPYDGTDPRDSPDHYLTYTYDQAGTAAASLTATWNAAITIDTNPPIDLEPILLTTTTQLDIVQTNTLLSGT